MSEPENIKAVIMGPCCICGDRGYGLSMGGPHICPPCDAGNFTPSTVMRQAKEIERLRAEIERLRQTVIAECASALEADKVLGRAMGGLAANVVRSLGLQKPSIHHALEERGVSSDRLDPEQG